MRYFETILIHRPIKIISDVPPVVNIVLAILYLPFGFIFYIILEICAAVRLRKQPDLLNILSRLFSYTIKDACKATAKWTTITAMDDSFSQNQQN